MPLYALWFGWDDRASPMSLMRFRWLARELSRSGSADYRLFVPGKRFDAVVFVKSMTDECCLLADQLRDAGTPVVFDANVDYYTATASVNIPAELLPSAEQRHQAITMTTRADFVLASSRHLADICKQYNPAVRWIPDNVNTRLVAPLKSPAGGDGRLTLWWSGMAQKILDFLSIEDVLREFSARIHLHLVTGDHRAAIARMAAGPATRIRSLLTDIPHTFHRFRSIRHLLNLYTHGGGVVISPRFLDNPYNLSHSEWKITLGMACGLPAIVSPQPSYLDVAALCRHPGTVNICKTTDDWRKAFEEALAGKETEERFLSAREVVKQHYATNVIAPRHLQALQQVIRS